MNERIALGTAQFGQIYGISNQYGLVTPEEVEKVITAATEAGIKTIDTAIAYGNSEKVLGNCGVADWEIVTKLPSIPDDCDQVEAWLFEQVEKSLDRLKVTAVYGLLLHNPQQLLGAQGRAINKALRQIQSVGYTKKIGVSIYDPNELHSILAQGQFDIVQAPLNILDRRLVESGWSLRLNELGIELHTRSVFLQGLMLMNDSLRPVKFNRWSEIWDEWRRWLKLNGLSPLQACLRYVLSIPEINRVIVGVENISQLQEILTSASGTLPQLPRWPSVPEVELISPVHWNKL